MLLIIPQESLIWEFVDQSNLLKSLKSGGGFVYWVASSELPSRIPGISLWMGLISIHMTARTELIPEFRRIVLVRRQLEGSASTRPDPFFSQFHRDS